MDPLFPTLPKKLSELSDKELSDLLAEHEEAAGLIDGDDQEFLSGLSADEIIEQYKAGAAQIKTLHAETDARAQAETAFLEAKAEIGKEIGLKAEAEEPAEEPAKEAEAEAEAGPETNDGDEEEGEEEAATPEAEKEPVLVADAEVEKPAEEKPRLRRPPTPAPDRVVVNEEPSKELSFTASGLLPSTPAGAPLGSREELAEAVRSLAYSLGSPTHHAGGREERYQVARLDYRGEFGDDRTLSKDDWQGNAAKIRAIGSPFFGKEGREALTASGGLCAPRTPIYTMPQYASMAEPVWDALPTFRAERGGVNVPTPTTIADADGSITTITEANDALGGTFATKACLDMDCPTYTQTDVTIISACREFGNLNAMAWPEKIAHEMELTMALRARTSESYILDQIKALSINVTGGADTLGSLIYLVDNIVKARFGIIGRLRMDPETVFRVLLPSFLPDLLQLDTVSTQFDRFRSEEDLVAYLRGYDIEPAFYIDTPSTGTSQLPDTTQAAGALDDIPPDTQWAIFPEGAFLGIDMAELNLGIVRDSTLNSTNDFQNFSEIFRNVARIGPENAAYWVTSDLCPTGQFPPAGTARAC